VIGFAHAVGKQPTAGINTVMKQNGIAIARSSGNVFSGTLAFRVKSRRTWRSAPIHGESLISSAF
jgi:hypothetical protein